ncbi:MAG: hypothetical protein QM817_24435 [Archangium sp.]
MTLLAIGCGREVGARLEAGKTIVVARSGGGSGGGAGGGGGGGGTGGSLGGGTGGSLGGGTGGSAGGGGGGGSSCHGLGVEDCRKLPDCAPDFCTTCTCTPTYEQCRSLNELPFQCPMVDCITPQCCADQSQCSTFPSTCSPPGSPPGCGVCDTSPSTCTSDSSCGSGFICQPRVCGCLGQTDCVPGCGPNNPCGVGEVCSFNRCQPKECMLDSECPSTFECRVGHVAGFCRRRVCTDDVECGDGFCVEGTCYEALGECRGPVP